MFARGRGARAFGGEEDRRRQTTIIGAEFTLDCGLRLVVIARNRAGYARLSRLITRGRRAAEKGSYSLARADVEEFVGRRGRERWRRHAGVVAAAARARGGWSRANGWRAPSRAAPGSRWSSCATAAIASGWRGAASSARALGLPLTAAGDVHMHVRERRRLQDALTAVRHGVTRGRGRRRGCIPTANVTCANARGSRGSIHPSCWRKP